MILKLVYYDMYSKCMEYHSLCTAITHTDTQELQEKFSPSSKFKRISQFSISYYYGWSLKQKSQISEVFIPVRKVINFVSSTFIYINITH